MVNIKVSTLGEEKESNKYKIYYFLLIIAIFVYLAWSAIGVMGSPEKTRMVTYYMWLGLIAVAFILFDNATVKKFPYIDSVTIEKTPINPKFIFLIGLLIAGFIGFRVYTTQIAFVPYPQFQVFDSTLPNAILSGVCGLVEDLFFFVFLLPTIFAVIQLKFFKNFVLSGITSVFIISILFTVFHIFVFGIMNEVALFSSFIFAVVCSGTVILLRTAMLAHVMHFTNNIVASIIIAKVAFVFW